MIVTIGSKLLDADNNEYIVKSTIKPGGFGQVFLATRKLDNKEFAIKTMLNAFPSSAEYEAFQNELHSAAEIISSNVIHYEYLHDGTTFSSLPPYIIMEYANGGTLADLINSKRLNKTYFSNEELLLMFQQLANGMMAINSKLVHRDIKPQNILIQDGILKITDFGLAKYAEATTRDITFKGYGTAPYSAPEVWKNEKNTIQMDIYSMGIVFYELATFQYPYSVTARDYSDAHLFKAINPPNQINPNLSPSIVSVINKMLQKPISRRFATWEEIITFISADSTTELNTNILSLTQAAIKMQNATDSAFQKKHAEEEKKKHETEILCKTIMTYFKNEILDEVMEYINIFNSQYASGKIILSENNFNPANTINRMSIKMPNQQKIEVSLSVILPENFTQNIGFQNNGNYRTVIGRKTTLPVCNGKKIWAWGIVEDNYHHGYNLLLLDNDIDEYGEWWILYNRNSGLNSKPRPEPFAFSFDELPKEINHINAMHIYSSEVEKYNFDRFQEIIALGHLRPI